ncbi:MAG TPA: hypothetical protein VM938_02065 [Acidimicrobiales bacterium]|nr:hypothetical protein [Acidimicrobiales bacterium]
MAVAAVQLLIIAVVPSTAEKESDLTSLGAGNGSGSSFVDADGDGIDDAVDPSVVGGPGGSSGPGGTSPGGTGPGDPNNPNDPTRPGPGQGDTKHCVNGKQYDPALYEWAPPCVGKFTGTNGGAPRGTRGVTGDSIKVVAMLGNYGAAVQKILESQGSPSFAQFSKFAEAAEKFLNENYEFYGRKVDIVPYQFKSTTGGEKAPNHAELKIEVRQMVQKENPFAATWANSVSSDTYRELSQLKVVNIGGYGFTDEFNASLRPYHWDVQMGGYEMADEISTWYCTRMHGGGSAKAAYAKNSTTATGVPLNLQDRPRKLGVVTTDDPENLKTVERLKALVKSKCGVVVENEYKYAQDISTLPQQRRAAYESMVAKGTVTTVMCFCDQVAPQFLYKTFTDERYFPETVIVGTGVMDLDRSAQAYDHGAEYPQKPSQKPPSQGDGNYEQFENAFGLAQFPKQGPFDANSATKVYKAGGYADALYASAEEELHYYAMLGAMIQMAGPNLTAFAVETGATRTGLLGTTTNEKSSQRSLAAGNYTWNDSLREVYWAPMTPSQFNNVKGSYTSLNGGRSFLDGRFPSGLLSLPAKPRP